MAYDAFSNAREIRVVLSFIDKCSYMFNEFRCLVVGLAWRETRYPLSFSRILYRRISRHTQESLTLPKCAWFYHVVVVVSGIARNAMFGGWLGTDTARYALPISLNVIHAETKG